MYTIIFNNAEIRDLYIVYTQAFFGGNNYRYISKPIPQNHEMATASDCLRKKSFKIIFVFHDHLALEMGFQRVKINLNFHLRVGEPQYNNWQFFEISLFNYRFDYLRTHLY